MASDTANGGRAVGPLELGFNGLDGLRWWSWLPVLIGPAAIGLVFAAHFAGWNALSAKGPQERLSIYIMGLTTAVLIVRTLRSGVRVGELAFWVLIWLAATAPAACLLDYRHFHKLAGLPRSTAVQVFFAAMIPPGLGLALYTLNRMGSKAPALVAILLVAITFLCREIHFQGTHKGVYLSVLMICGWVWTWRRSIDAPLAIGWRKPMLLMTAATYALSVTIARGLWDWLPMVDDLSTALEETVENAAHLMLLATAFADLWPRPGVPGVPGIPGIPGAASVSAEAGGKGAKR